MRNFLTVSAVVLGLLGASASSALAAKGVKKNPANGAHTAHGVVTHVHHQKAPAKGKGAAAGGNIGEITIKTHHTKKKGQAATKGAKVTNHTHKFTVSSSTKFTQTKGKNKQASGANFASVRAGEHVAITAKGTHAESVVIHHHAKK